MKKLYSAVVLSVFSLVASAQSDVWTKGYVWNAASNSGTDVWLGPGNKVENVGAFTRSINNSLSVSAASGGLNVAETGTVALRDGRTVALASTRFASTANLFKGVKAVAGGPLGVSLLLMEAMPALLDWVNGDSAINIRWNSSASPARLEKKDSSVCSSGTCYAYYFPFGTIPSTFTATDVAGECARGVAAMDVVDIYRTYVFTGSGGSGAIAGCAWSEYNNSGSLYSTNATYMLYQTVAPLSPAWLPASMADIEPYMTPRVPAPALLSQIVATGTPVDVAPVSVATVTSPPALTPYVETTDYPKPADKSTVVTVPGNPFSLANNTPTVTNQSTSEKLLNPSSTSHSGVPPSNLNWPSPGPVSTPTQSTTTSTFNPTTSATTSNTVTSQDAAQQVSTSTTTTNISNTSNTSNVTYNTTNVTNVTNTTTSTPLAPTKTDTSNSSPTSSPLPDQATDCDKHPSSLGCSEAGTFTDSALPSAPSLYTPKYPTGLVGVWNTGKAALLATPLGSVTAQLMPSGFSSGTCPSWMLPLALGAWDFGSHDVSPPCWIWDFGKAIIIISALLLARALIFGG